MHYNSIMANHSLKLDPLTELQRLTEPCEQAKVQTDSELLALYLETGSRQALESIVRRHAPMVAGVVRRLTSDRATAEDAFQATFLVLLKSARRIRNHRSLSAWLYGVAYRVACRARQQFYRSKHHTGGEEQIVDSLTEKDDPLVSLARQLELETLDQELQRLPTHLRDPLIEHYLLGHTAPQIAERMELSVTAVEGRLRRGRRALRLRLAQRGVSLSVVLLGTSWVQRSAYAGSAADWLDRGLDPLLSESTIQAITTTGLESVANPKILSYLEGELIMRNTGIVKAVSYLAASLLVVGAVGLAAAEWPTSIGNHRASSSSRSDPPTAREQPIVMEEAGMPTLEMGTVDPFLGQVSQPRPPAASNIPLSPGFDNLSKDKSSLRNSGGGGYEPANAGGPLAQTPREPISGGGYSGGPSVAAGGYAPAANRNLNDYPGSNTRSPNAYDSPDRYSTSNPYGNGSLSGGPSAYGRASPYGGGNPYGGAGAYSNASTTGAPYPGQVGNNPSAGGGYMGGSLGGPVGVVNPNAQSNTTGTPFSAQSGNNPPYGAGYTGGSLAGMGAGSFDPNGQPKVPPTSESQTWIQPNGNVPKWVTRMQARIQKREEEWDAIETKLDQLVEPDFSNQPLCETIELLSKQVGGLPLLIDVKELEKIGLSPDEQITLQNVGAIPLRSALRLILDPLELTWNYRDNVVMVTSKENGNSQDMRFYDLSYILPTAAYMEFVVDMLRTVITKANWDVDGGPDTLSVFGPILVANCPLGIHEEIENALFHISKINPENLKSLPRPDATKTNKANSEPGGLF